MSLRTSCPVLAFTAILAASLQPGASLLTAASAQSLVAEPARTIESGDDTMAPAIAFDTSRNRHLVVYERVGIGPWSTIRARLLDAAGRPVGSEIPVATAAGSLVSPVVGYNPAIDEYLVVWVNTQIAPRVVAQRVAAGSLAFVGTAFVVCDIVELWQSAHYPAVAANPLAGATARWMVTWSDNRRAMSDPVNYRVYGALLTATGERAAPTMTMTDPTSVSTDPARSSVAFSPRSNQFVVLFNDPGKPSQSDWIAQVDVTTASVTSRFALNGGEAGTEVSSQGLPTVRGPGRS